MGTRRFSYFDRCVYVFEKRLHNGLRNKLLQNSLRNKRLQNGLRNKRLHNGLRNKRLQNSLRNKRLQNGFAQLFGDVEYLCYFDRVYKRFIIMKRLYYVSTRLWNGCAILITLCTRVCETFVSYLCTICGTALLS